MPLVRLATVSLLHRRSTTFGDHVTTNEAHLQFLESFNEDLRRLACGARVAAVADTVREMVIMDLDGTPVGRIPTRIEPETFAAMMLLIEDSFAQGVVAGKGQRPAAPRDQSRDRAKHGTGPGDGVDP